MTDTSLTLLDGLRHKDTAHAWERLVRLYEPVIRAWLRSYSFQPADEDDLCQDVLQRLSQSMAAFRHAGVPGSFRGWLRSITMNAMRDFWRRKQCQIPLAAGISMPEKLRAIVDNSDELLRRWDEEYNTVLVQGALSLVKPHFDPTTWDAFCRVTFDGQSPQRVASDLSISVNSVYLARSRVLRRLRVEIRGLLD